MTHCEWAVCGYVGFLVLVSLLYVGIVRIVIRTHPRMHYVLTGLDNLPAATGMYFILIKNRTIPTYNNETNTKKTLISTNTTHCYSTYQHEAIKSRSRQLLMMGTWLPETC